MTHVAASSLATALTLAMLGGSAVSAMRQESQAAARFQTAVHEPAEFEDRMRLGECRIRYDNLANDRQPAAMECEHAHWVAQRWGGVVLERTNAGLIERAVYQGRNNFAGVPTHNVPRAGWCRAWIDGATEQPDESDCRTAERIAAAQGGHVLFMPL